VSNGGMEERASVEVDMGPVQDLDIVVVANSEEEGGRSEEVELESEKALGIVPKSLQAKALILRP